jgi:hypothetical protein
MMCVCTYIYISIGIVEIVIGANFYVERGHATG